MGSSLVGLAESLPSSEALLTAPPGVPHITSDFLPAPAGLPGRATQRWRCSELFQAHTPHPSKLSSGSSWSTQGRFAVA